VHPQTTQHPRHVRPQALEVNEAGDLHAVELVRLGLAGPEREGQELGLGAHSPDRGARLEERLALLRLGLGIGPRAGKHRLKRPPISRVPTNEARCRFSSARRTASISDDSTPRPFAARTTISTPPAPGQMLERRARVLIVGEPCQLPRERLIELQRASQISRPQPIKARISDQTRRTAACANPDRLLRRLAERLLTIHGVHARVAGTARFRGKL
jgi:hypothetical protein